MARRRVGRPLAERSPFAPIVPRGKSAFSNQLSAVSGQQSASAKSEEVSTPCAVVAEAASFGRFGKLAACPTGALRGIETAPSLRAET